MRRKPTGSSSNAKHDGKGKARKGRRRKGEDSSSSLSSEVISLSKTEDSQKPIATMKVSLARKAILNTETISSEQPAKKSSTTPTNGNLPSTTQTPVVESKNAVDDIWSRLDNGAIDIKYATVGYGPNGRLILDHDILVTLLINYGYKIDDVLAFIDDFNGMSENDNDFPLVMMNSHVYDIYENVNPIVRYDSGNSKNNNS